MTSLQNAALCALADLIGIMPEYDQEHPGWNTIVELYDSLKSEDVDVSDYMTEVEKIRKGE